MTILKLLFTMASIMVLFFACTDTVREKRILVVVAHPDDETAFAPALAKFSRVGHKVQLVVATDGRFSNHGDPVPNPDSLALDNKSQVVCSCDKLKMEAPIFCDLVSLDRKHGRKDGVRDAVESGVLFREKLKNSILKFQPDVIITYGPDGEYGHPEHIVLSSLVTELLLREDWVSKYPLYYFGWTRSLEEGNDGWIRYVDDDYFNVVVNYTEEDEQRAFESLNCYRRIPANEKESIIEIERKRKNELFFREFSVAKERRDDFFTE